MDVQNTLNSDTLAPRNPAITRTAERANKTIATHPSPAAHTTNTRTNRVTTDTDPDDFRNQPATAESAESAEAAGTAGQSTVLPTYESYAHAPTTPATVESYARAFLTYLQVRNRLTNEVTGR